MVDALEHALEEILIPQLPAPIAGALAPSPYNFAFTGEDALRLTVHNSQSGVRVAVHWRMLNRGQAIIANRVEFTPASDRSASSTEFAIGEGYLLNMTVVASAGSPQRGQTFARLQVIRGRDAAAVVLGTVVQGYVTAQQDRAWPGSPLEGSLDGDGWYRLIVGTDPAAGAEISETVPTGARWQILTFRAQLVTDATVGNRQVRLSINAGGISHMTVPSPSTTPASENQEHQWSNGFQQDTSYDTDIKIAGLPAVIVVLAGQRILTITSNLQAGDNYGAPRFTVREYLEAA